MNLFWWKRKETPTAATFELPEPGEEWIFSSFDGSPWPPKRHFKVKILDVQCGWVRYALGSVIFTDERKPVAEFTRMYQRAR